MLRDALKSILRDQGPPAVPGTVLERELVHALPASSNHALVLTGVRRSGKSVLQGQLMRAHAARLYCNLEDTRLYDLSPKDFPAFLSLVEELAPPGARVFLDEVQEIEGWQRLVRALLDRGRAVCLTGSNASLLGRELGSKLTGRHLSFEVFPFSYSEYLAYTRQSPGARSLTAYLDDGGFPAFLRERNPQILQELFRDIVQRDIAARHRLRETRHLMNLMLFLLANTGQPLSMQGLTKSLAIPTVTQTSRYLEYAEDAYLVFALPKFSPSFRRRVVTPSKYYAVDNGLRRVSSPQDSADWGHRLENAVFLALRRNGASVSYAGEKDRWECDFVTPAEAIQVCASLRPENEERELRGVLEAARLPGGRRPASALAGPGLPPRPVARRQSAPAARRAMILTLDQRDVATTSEGTVEILPTWEWLLRTSRSVNAAKEGPD